MKMKKPYFLIVLLLCGLSVGNLFAAASAAAAAAAVDKNHLGNELREAIADGNEAQVAALIAAKADVNTSDAALWSPLQWAALTGNSAIVQMLLDAGAQVNIAEEIGSTPLIHAARYGHIDTAYLLLDAGAKVNTQDTQGITALMEAARKGHKELVKLLLSWGADKTVPNLYGNTAEYQARLNDHEEIANIISVYVPSPTRDEMANVFFSEREETLRAIEEDRAPDSLLGLLPGEIASQEIAARVLESAEREMREIVKWLETHSEGMTAEEENERRRRLDTLANPSLEGGAGAGL